MATLRTKFSVGLFLIIGMVAVIVGVIWLGLSNYLDRGRFFASYFDESVQGLDKDSPVKYRGVAIGRVQAINVAPDERLIEVIMQIDSQIEPQQTTQDIVAQLKSVGITGLMFIELERRDPQEADVSPKFNFKPPHPVIPTRPSEISKIFKGIEDIFSLFRSLDMAISTHLTGVLEKIDTALEEMQLAQLMKDMRTGIQTLQALLNTDKIERLLAGMDETTRNFNRMALNADSGVSEIRDTVADLNRAIDSTGGNVASITADLKISAQQIKTAMEAATALVESTDYKVDALQRQTLITLQRVEQAGQTLNRLLERIANQPSQLIFSAPAGDKPAAP
jgi:phospholipid/cholesterol/gamma-HCH transport system substrate-binding protein